ncbi:MAG: ABC transporter permease [Verrucomicrobia bacterium]|nr:MAG: ABC transporter permease [Verrucomicrobiota bacterium]
MAENRRAGEAQGDGDDAGAVVRVERTGDGLVLWVGGDWRLRRFRPDAAAVVREAGEGGLRRVTVRPDSLGFWDSSLALFLWEVRRQVADRCGEVDLSRMPSVIDTWIRHLDPEPADEAGSKADGWHFPVLTWIGLKSARVVERAREMLAFLGECALAAAEVLRHPGRLRRGEVIAQMRRAGAEALGIVGLITFLVGVILAFVAAMQLRQFGADIYVADLIGLAMFREMGAMMAAIVLAGRTGAAYAAELGNMRLNEEIDALETFGVSSMQFLVMPRMLALIVMLPMLTLYADFLGSLGGLIVSKVVLQVPASAFVRQIEGAVQLKDVFAGLIKSVFFGMVVAYASCMKGMRAERSAVGVGEATTAAVVLSILLIIIADAMFTVLFSVIRF